MRIKDICDFISRGTTPDYVENSPYKVMNQATFSKGLLDQSNIRYTSKADKDAQIRKGDLLMASTGGGVLGKVYYFDCDDDSFYADSHVSILRNSKGDNLMKYLYYHFSIKYEEINATMVKGSTNQTELQRNYLLAYEIKMPSLQEQQKIVDYLDKKLAAIDHRVELLEKEKDAYTRLKKSVILQAVSRGLNPNVPLKDSCKDWIGMIPEHWQAKRIKDVVELMKEKTTDTSGPYIALENIESWNGKFIETDAETEGTNNVFCSGDILFGKLRPYLAKGFIPSYNGICSTEFFVMRATKYCNSKYFLYYILSKPVIDYIKNKVAGVKMPRTNWAEFGGLSFFMPPLSEQQAIADYLDEKCAKIDAAIENISKQIDASKRLKKAVINEAISGKLFD